MRMTMQSTARGRGLTSEHAPGFLAYGAHKLLARLEGFTQTLLGGCEHILCFFLYLGRTAAAPGRRRGEARLGLAQTVGLRGAAGPHGLRETERAHHALSELRAEKGL